MEKVDINSFYMYNIGEVHNIEINDDVESIMGNQKEDGE